MIAEKEKVSDYWGLPLYFMEQICCEQSWFLWFLIYTSWFSFIKSLSLMILVWMVSRFWINSICNLKWFWKHKSRDGRKNGERKKKEKVHVVWCVFESTRLEEKKEERIEKEETKKKWVTLLGSPLKLKPLAVFYGMQFMISVYSNCLSSRGCWVFDGLMISSVSPISMLYYLFFN